MPCGLYIAIARWNTRNKIVMSDSVVCEDTSQQVVWRVKCVMCISKTSVITEMVTVEELIKAIEYRQKDGSSPTHRSSQWGDTKGVSACTIQRQ